MVNVEGMYYSNQSILYVGEGDFSFSSSHATRFGVANNIVATSLDLRGTLEVFPNHQFQNVFDVRFMSHVDVSYCYTLCS